MYFPGDIHRLNDNGSNRDVKAIVEVKMLTAYTTRHSNSNTRTTRTTPVDQITRMIVSLYNKMNKKWT